MMYIFHHNINGLRVFITLDNHLSVLIEDTKCLQLLAKVYQQSGSPQQAFKALTSARELQSKWVHPVEQWLENLIVTNKQ